MTRLFIANCTKQDCDFNFRLPENRKLIQVRIPKGCQSTILGELQDTDIAAITRQHSRYGLIHVDEAKKVKAFAGLCWSNKEIPAKLMQGLYDHNQEALEQKGEEQRKEAAVVVKASIDTSLKAVGESTTAVEVMAEELKAPGDENKDPGLKQTIRVDERAESGKGKRK